MMCTSTSNSSDKINLEKTPKRDNKENLPSSLRITTRLLYLFAGYSSPPANYLYAVYVL